MRRISAIALVLAIFAPGLAAAEESPYLQVLAIGALATGLEEEGLVGTTVELLTRRYRVDMWIPRSMTRCTVTLYRADEVEDDDPEKFLYDSVRLGTFDDADCSGGLTQRGLSSGAVRLPSVDILNRAFEAFREDPFDAMTASSNVVDSSFDMRDRLPRSFLDNEAQDRQIENYRLSIYLDVADRSAQFRVIFDTAEGICIYILSLGRAYPELTESLIMLPPPRETRSIELQDDGCDGVFDHAFLDFSQIELGLGGYLINGRWVAQTARTMSLALAMMDWTDQLVTVLVDAR